MTGETSAAREPITVARFSPEGLSLDFPLLLRAYDRHTRIILQAQCFHYIPIFLVTWWPIV
jgi:hypothetical protein